MTNPLQSGIWILRLSLGITVGLALAVVLTAATPSAQAQYTVLHNFSGEPGDGANPFAGLTIDSRGNLYGTTVHGGTTGYGEVFMLKRSGSTFTFNPLYSFTGGGDGAGPYARVVFGPSGALYGTAAAGGDQGCHYGEWKGCGTVFSLRPPATACKTALCPWTQSLLYTFTGSPDGGEPQGDLKFDAAGTIYGTTVLGGIGPDKGLGTIYHLSPSGGGWSEEILYQAPGEDIGGYPYDGVVFDTFGNLYGVFAAYGPTGAGAVYQLTPSGSSWSESTIGGFLDANTDGNVPEGGLIIDQAGNLYGTTTNAGSEGGGTVFQLMPPGGSWTFSVLYSLANGPEGGTENGPEAKLAMDAAGNLYGTTVRDGKYGYGSVFKLTPPYGQQNYTPLYDFCLDAPVCSDGAHPISNVSLHYTNGVVDALYGTASAGGSQGHGVVWEITP